MIDPNKLWQLSPGQKRRKLALCFGALERDIVGLSDATKPLDLKGLSRADYIKALCGVVLKDPKLPQEAARQIAGLLAAGVLDERRVCNIARNSLLAILGTFPGEWDLIIAPHGGSAAGEGSEMAENARVAAGAPALGETVRERRFFPGVCIYAEDIRSPFNLGSIFRTAEAMGAEKIYLSPLCADPTHPRAIRSAMGCIEKMGYERLLLEALPTDMPIFVLETGGTPIDQFDFPPRGICIVGSEELGASPEALRRAAACVSIPMVGLKASLNVGVALGILLQKWTEKLV